MRSSRLLTIASADAGSRLRLTGHALPHARQGGAVAMMFALLLIPLIGLCGLAIDLSIIYARHVEMQNVADAIALSAAKRLDGTAAGINAAVAAAADVAASMRYQNHQSRFSWSSSALQFGAAPRASGAWSDAGSAASSPVDKFYVMVDTAAFADAGTVNTALIRVLSASFATVTVSGQAIAGRTSIDVVPLAICAMSSNPAASRSNPSGPAELVEYGFRRGISYDLMHLNPAGTTPLNYAVDPLVPPGGSATGAALSGSTLAPYVCRGSLAIPGLQGGKIRVAQAFPLSSLADHLNSRFDKYQGSSTCTANGAPPDTNIHPYTNATVQWSMIAPTLQQADEYKLSGILQTIADTATPVAPADKYGPVWAHAKAVPFTSYKSGALEPASGYTPYPTSAWPYLYNNQSVRTTPISTAYPSSVTPYRMTQANAADKPSAAHAPGVRNRRILNIPLLDCASVPGSSANVMALGRFFMTVPATSTVLAAEFGGAFPVEQLTATVGLF